MIDLLPFLLDKALAAFVVWWFVDRFRKAQRTRRLRATHCFGIGVAGYNFVSMWVSGFLYMLVNGLFWFCLGASIVSMLFSIYRQHKEDQRWRREADTDLKAIDERLERMGEATLFWHQGVLSDDEYDALLDELRSQHVTHCQAMEARCHG
jgi:hypothetical protein